MESGMMYREEYLPDLEKTKRIMRREIFGAKNALYVDEYYSFVVLNLLMRG